MTVKELTPEEIEQNWKTFCTYIDKLGNRAPAAKAMVEHLGERLCLAPASSRISYHNCFPGGLVDHSLRVLRNAVKLCKAFGWDVPTDSLIIGCLFHDLGKVGDMEHDHYVPNDSSYHRDVHGALYKANKEFPFMTVPDRGVWLCAQFDLKLNHDEWLAIKLNDGAYEEANRAYGLKEPQLAVVVHMADLIATRQEKEMC